MAFLQRHVLASKGWWGPTSLREPASSGRPNSPGGLAYFGSQLLWKAEFLGGWDSQQKKPCSFLFFIQLGCWRVQKRTKRVTDCDWRRGLRAWRGSITIACCGGATTSRVGYCKWGGGNASWGEMNAGEAQAKPSTPRYLGKVLKSGKRKLSRHRKCKHVCQKMAIIEIRGERRI